MSILTNMKKKVMEARRTVDSTFSNSPKSAPATVHTLVKIKLLVILFAIVLLSGCEMPKEQIVLRKIKDVVVDGTTDPTLKAQVVLYNPNTTRMKLKKIKVDIFYNDKKVGEVDQKLALLIPSQSEFSIPLEVRLAIKELGFVETLLSMIGGKKMLIHYKGHLKLTYHGFPIRVPVDYKDEIRVKF